MKVIIIEGTDNTGKNTLIQGLCELYNHVMLIHCTTPPKKYTNTQKAMYQDASFYSYANKLCSHFYDDVADIVIFNRAWYGEYVYGTLYRNRTKESVKNMLDTIETSLNEVNSLDVYYVQLVCDSTELLKKNDDGKSISNRIDNIIHETDLFVEAFSNSSLKKLLVKVNEDDNFKDKNAILNDVLKFIND